MAVPSDRFHARCLSFLFALILSCFCCARVAIANPSGTTYIWPINNSATPDEMNTSFGPRINNSKWDFHDGIDLPGACGTDVHAVADGVVVSAGDANPPTWNSRRVVLKVNDANDGDVYVYYLHLDSIANFGQLPYRVSRGDVLGKLGDDDATYCHLHIEFRRGGTQQVKSYHPLRYLPYTNTANFTAPTNARFNRQANGLMAARLLFSAVRKLEGDLERVVVDLKNGTTLLETRVVDLNDKTTIQEGNDDAVAFTNDIAVEGYQRSNMVDDDHNDLQYGVIVRNLPNDCNTLVARVYDVRNTNVVTSEAIPVPNQIATEQFLNFEDGVVAPAGWTQRVSSNQNVAIANSETTSCDDTITTTRSLVSTDNSDSSSQHQAGIEYNLPGDRFEWVVEADIRPTTLNLTSQEGKQVYFLHFLALDGTNLSAAARVRTDSSGSILAGIAAEQPDRSRGDNSTFVIVPLSCRHWKLHLRRVGTRETTAELYLDDVEAARLLWNPTTTYEPRQVRVGIGRSFSQVKATLNTDNVLVSEKTF